MNVLIIGKNSYIGNHIDDWLTQFGHNTEQLDVLTDTWQSFDYSSFDVLVHMAGIVHQPQCTDWNLYKKVNTDMPFEIAQKAKAQGVRQFVYFSTMGVYKVSKELFPSIVDENTQLLEDGNSMYGKSKLLAERKLNTLHDDTFNVSIVRPPSVYGKDCKGGYISGFTKIAKMMPIIPRAYENVRQSFIYIDNLSECVRIIIENKLTGVFCPQDDETPNANRLLSVIRYSLGKKYYSSKILGFFLKAFSFISLVKKAYGGIEYDRSLSNIPGFDYIIVPFEEGIKRTIT